MDGNRIQQCFNSADLRRFEQGGRGPARLRRMPSEYRHLRVLDQMRNVRRRIAMSRDGAVAVEFAIVVPVLLFFVTGTIMFGWVFFLQNNMENAAREAVRRMSVAEASFGGASITCGDPALPPASAEAYACSYLPNIDAFTIQTGQNCTDRTVSVRVTADGSSSVLADIFGVFAGRTLAAQVTMRMEGTC